ncbi:MAG: MFS family permease [Parasphingorhabdus sp.]|jgi:MFS family permease
MTSLSRQRAIIAFAFGTIFFAYAFIQRVAPSVMTEELMRDFSVGGAALGGLSAWYFYAYASIQLPVGILTDRFGARKLMTIAALVCAVASIGFAHSESILTASISRALIGASVAFGFVGTLSIASAAFSARRFSMLAGIVQAVGMLGAIMGQAPLRIAIESIGWRQTSLALGIAAIALAVAIFAAFPAQQNNISRQIGKDVKTPSTFNGLMQVLRNPQSWLCAGTGFGLTATMLAFAGLWAVPWLSVRYGLNKTESASIASLLFLGWAIASPMMGWLSDHIGRRKPVMLTGCIFNLLFISLILFAGAENTVIISVLFLATGISGSAMTVVFGTIRELNSGDLGNTSLGLMNMFVVGSGAVMQPAIGWLLDFGWEGTMIAGARIYSPENYSIALSSLLFVNLIALFCILAMQETFCKSHILSANN